MKILFEIFKVFFIIGAQLIGGGYVIFPLLKKYVVEDKSWLKEEELTDYLALSQCLPGIIALNISVFSGWRIARFMGALAAILGLLLPSFLIIIMIAGCILYVGDNKILQNVFAGVRLSVIVLLLYMIMDIFKCSIKTFFPFFLFLIILIGVFFGLTPTLAIIFAIIVATLKGVLKDV